MFRRVGLEDKEVFCAIMDEFYHTDAVLHPVEMSVIENTFAELVRSDVYLEGYLFQVEEEIAGYALLAKSFSPEVGGPVIWLEEVYIRPAFQGQGLGRDFFDFVESENGSQIKRLRLEVEQDNERAIKLYKNLGYKVLAYQQMVKELI